MSNLITNFGDIVGHDHPESFPPHRVTEINGQYVYEFSANPGRYWNDKGQEVDLGDQGEAYFPTAGRGPQR